MNVNARIKMGLSALLCLLVLLGVVFSAAYASEENTKTLGLSLDSPVEYPVFVEGIPVTGANMNDVLVGWKGILQSEQFYTDAE